MFVEQRQERCLSSATSSFSCHVEGFPCREATQYNRLEVGTACSPSPPPLPRPRALTAALPLPQPKSCRKPRCSRRGKRFPSCVRGRSRSLGAAEKCLGVFFCLSCVVPSASYRPPLTAIPFGPAPPESYTRPVSAKLFLCLELV